VDAAELSRSGDNYVEPSALSAGISRAQATQPNGNVNTQPRRRRSSAGGQSNQL